MGHHISRFHPWLLKGRIRILAQIMLFVMIAGNLFGCAIRYWDEETGAEHIWGFGHLAIKSTEPRDGKQALIRKSTLSGVGIGIDDGSFGLSIGWDQKERLIIYDDSTAITIERFPSENFFEFRIGTYPFGSDSEANNKETFQSREDPP